MKRKYNGFTLMELLVAIAIISILITMGIIGYIHATMKARIAAHNANVKTLEAVGQVYVIENDSDTLSLKALVDNKLVQKPKLNKIGFKNMAATTSDYEVSWDAIRERVVVEPWYASQDGTVLKFPRRP